MPLKTESLASMCEAVIDCSHSTPVWTKSGYIVLRNQNIKDGRLDLSEPSYTDEEHFKQRIRRIAPRPGDIVITREAPMGEVCKIPEGLTCCLGQRQVLLRPKADVDADYLLYALQSPFVKNQIRWNEGTGSTVSNIRIPVLEKIDIPRHDQAETSIAKALGMLDSQIDLNRRINQTLEAMAQAIFKSWFVDFDPVKAKIAAIEQGEDPLRAAMLAISGKTDTELDQMPREHYDQLAATAALFPDEMEESELGEIPKGWGTALLSKLTQLIGGGTPKRSESRFWDGTIPWFSVRDVPNDGDVWVVDTVEKITEVGLLKSSTKLLRKGTTIISARGTVGKLAMVGQEMGMNQSCYGVLGAEGIGDFFNYFNLRFAVETLKRNTHGAVFDTITQATFETVTCVKPDNSAMKKFDEIVDPLLKRIQSNVFQSRELAELRDALLPKLLSGEVSVETLMHEVAL